MSEVGRAYLVLRDRRYAACASGYTFVELLIVLSLVALLVTLALPRYTAAIEGAKQRARDQNLATLRDALDKFRADQGRYPAELAELVQKKYLRAIPQDPVTGTSDWTVVRTGAGAATTGAPEPHEGITDLLPPATERPPVLEPT